MTREQLDNIRARVFAALPTGAAAARSYVDDLLAEVERLRDAHAMTVQVSGELCEKCGWAMKFPGEKCRCELLAEVERLKGDRSEINTAKLNDAFTEGTLAAGEAMRPQIAAAFQRGVAAMREAARFYFVSQAGEAFNEHDNFEELRQLRNAKAIRTLPDPKDTE